MAELFNSLPEAAVLRTFAQYLIAFCSRLEEASDVISCSFVGLTFPDDCVKCRDPRLNRSEEILPKAIECGIFGPSSNFDKCRPEAAGDFISNTALDPLSRNVSASLVIRR